MSRVNINRINYLKILKVTHISLVIWSGSFYVFTVKEDAMGRTILFFSTDSIYKLESVLFLSSKGGKNGKSNTKGKNRIFRDFKFIL